MFAFNYKIRVRYAETDKMGYAYYGNYATYFEIARVEALRSVGVSYKKMEDNGIILPVLNMQIKYIKPAFYDEKLLIKLKIKAKPRVKIIFDYEIYNEKKELINIAKVILVFVDIKTQKPCKPSKNIDIAFASFF